MRLVRISGVLLFMLVGLIVNAADYKKFTDLKVISGKIGNINSIAFSPDGKILATGGSDKIIRFWSVATTKEVRTLTGHDREIKAVLFTPDGKNIVSIEHTTDIRVWDVETGKELRKFGRGIFRIAVSPDGKYVAASNDDGHIILLDTGSGKEIKQTSEDQPHLFCSLVFSPDGKIIAAGTDKKQIIFYDTETLKEIRKIPDAYEYNIESLDFSPDGKTVAACCPSDNKEGAKIFDITTGEEVMRFLPGNGKAKYNLRLVKFAPDGKTLVTVSNNQIAPRNVSRGCITFWNAQTGEELQQFDGYVMDIRSIAFNKSGSLLASGGADDTNTIMIWGEKRR